MKKIYIALTTILFTFASCSMELTPEGEILDEEALETVDDYESFTNGVYAMMRSVTSGDFVVLSDIQLDDFHAVIGNGNRRMDFYNGSFNPSTGEIASIYGGYYAIISQTNFFLDKAEARLKDKNLTKENRARMNRYVGAVRFFRAYCYNSLADKFCGSYKRTADLDAPGKGLSLQLTYSPTADNTKYPARSSMRATYAQILSDLNSALTDIQEYEKSENVVPAHNSNYITSDAVKALLARVSLNMGEDSLAFVLAKDIIDTGRYPLVERNAFKNLWLTDNGTEVIWQVQADYTYHGSSTGTAFASNTQNSDYVPTNECIYLFDENDSRWSAWFEETPVSNSGGTASMYRFMKYPGNSELYSGNSNFVNKAKPFRSAEMYLIAAEASYNRHEEDNANFYLNLIKGNRINRYRGVELAGVELLAEIQNERHREMMGEGFRISDLKRWNLGFTRGEVWENSDNVIVSNYKHLHYDADDYRLVWPIPQHEIDANPQIKGQQNSGY
ncbi:MAG: RagB/SusD family nutrient uptake outer membrane protein [Prevotellaceae bacterium]|nr:RagB/SusD family nutrient uptake outer membrane protein [Candidatus Minthosoma caballi]